jgi:hypothetical protein
MPLRIRQIDQHVTPSAHLSLQAFAQVLSPSIVDDVLRECSAHESSALVSYLLALSCSCMSL